ncbi:unnamed protein product [Blepharisma stoltei]|uniref:USP domain-containing protein n=1 Tax=Blepharisma stoltei TaxID=1481888 RepID=A0AAU9JNB3_9CILI|nr:unnamed protein product [Blepharisma stoltei]
MGSGCLRGEVEENEQKNNIQKYKESGTMSLNTTFTILGENYESIPNLLNAKNLVSNKSDIGCCGLENLGNSCYLNAALQCLFNCQPLVDYFLSDIYKKDIKASVTKKGQVTVAFAEIIKTYWSDQFDIIVPSFFAQKIWNLAPTIEAGKENDVHELMSFLLDRLDQDLNRAFISPALANIDINDNTQEMKAAKAWQMHLSCHSSVIVDLFQGQLRSTVTCKECEFQSQKFDEFSSLSLPIPHRSSSFTLNDCLKEFTTKEELEKAWFCPKCDKTVKAFKKFDIWKVPPILVIHLKRFKLNGKEIQKIHNFVGFPIHGLNLSKFVSSTQREKPVYDLFAKIDHEGDMGSGHYTATAKNRNNNSWHLFDDSNVYSVLPQQCVDENAYVLFYQKVSVDKYFRQSKNMPNYWPHVLQRNSV